MATKNSSEERRATPYKGARSRHVQTLLIIYVLLWPAALLAAPALWIYHPLAGIAYALVVGLHINTQLGFFYHELWHKVFFKKQKYNRFFYWIISFYHLSGPQIYGIAHASHHKDIHTFNDLEFWPRGKNQSVAGARIALLFELCFGIIAWNIRAMPAIWKHKKYDRREGLLFLFGWMAIFATILLVSRAIYGSAFWWVAVAYWLHLQLFGIALRMLQYLEHLGITAPDLDYKTRTELTRNVAPVGFLNRLWHKLTLNETAEHTLHHVRAGIPYRRYAPLAPPTPSSPVRTVSATALPGIIWSYWKDPLRTIGPDSPDLKEIPASD